MELLKKSIVVGVSVTPEVGLEVAQVDFASKTVLKYGVKKLEYDMARREIADMDLFKETLQDLFFEFQIPKGTEIVLNMPTIAFKVNDYPAALDEASLSNAIEEELLEHPIFQNTESVISAVKLPNSTMQFNKIAYTAVQRTMLIEAIMYIKELGYKVTTIDTSLNSVLNALMYNERVNVDRDTSWILMVVESGICRVITMNGKDFVDSYEERVSIGEVLDDAENYSTVINAVSPILKNLPSKYLCVVSKTNIISAEVLASKLSYSAPVIHQEANSYAREPFINVGPEVSEDFANIISLDVIGAAIHHDFEEFSDVNFNFFNKSLGDLYTSEQPLEITLGGKVVVLTTQLLVTFLIFAVLIILVPAIAAWIYYDGQIKAQQNKLSDLERQEQEIQQFLKDNENISSDMFDEGDEIKIGLLHNKNIYSYYTIVGTEIPKKLWLTKMKLGSSTTIEGQADNLESVYAFFRSIKDYDPNYAIKLQKLGLAAKPRQVQILDDNNNDAVGFDTDSILTTLNADFYEFVISDAAADGAPANTDSNESNDLPGGLEPIGDSN